MDGFHNNNNFVGIDYRYPPWEEILLELGRITTSSKVLLPSTYRNYISDSNPRPTNNKVRTTSLQLIHALG
ncbi:hypothetical protein GYH30_041099 [Glycine max]|uniref:Uncharacterized protein n=1 Tax=Glycine max TaxID=3847 RepID=A0A0R0G272_SOYBN|nr:hypothetical protein GYH30_041099 [Glycine max]